MAWGRICRLLASGQPAILLTLLAAQFCLVEATVQGAIKLDNYTFDKVLALPQQRFLIKIDKPYAYGEKEDAFKVLAKAAHSVPQFLVGEVPVQEFGEKDNDGIRERFNLKKEDFPVFYYFDEAHREGLRYEGAIEADVMSMWLRRLGVKMPSIGTIVELDEISASYMKEPNPDLLATATYIAETEFPGDRKASIYLKIMEKIAEKGQAYIPTEITRVNKLLDGQLAATKKAELAEKMKILNVFSSATATTTKDEL
mmetsp:Transcript_7817/g.17051  ORF Transcript_7817/g.17051 Transcript_7817/m.17051 type:complete len:256 (+) Transcript_7817:71-838(+)